MLISLEWLKKKKKVIQYLEITEHFTKLLKTCTVSKLFIFQGKKELGKIIKNFNDVILINTD